MASRNNRILRILHRAVASGENLLDRIRRRISRNLGTNPPREIVAYQGYSDTESVHIRGRVLSNSPRGGPMDDDGWRENLVNTWRRWESDEVAGEPVTVIYQQHERTVMTDEEGYYDVRFPGVAIDRDRILWHNARARTGRAGREIEATHEIMIPPPKADFGVISDLDDTVIHTGIVSLLLAAKLTFLGNAKTRKPLDGVATLYQEFQRGRGVHAVNPIFYISSSPWNLHDLLVDFLRLNEIPPGPLLLRDLGLDREKFIKEQGHGLKQVKALSVMDSFPHLPFILIGDSGQDDPGIYAEIARLRPGRILAIYIRDVDPEMDSHRDIATHRAVERAAAAGVPMILARDSLRISEHAAQIGLIRDSALADIDVGVKADQARPETGDQAIQNTLDSILPKAPQH